MVPPHSASSSSKVQFSVCYRSGEDNRHPASELNYHSPRTLGWQTEEFCDYPQEIGLVLDNTAHLCQIQILSHHKKIATYIDLFAGQLPWNNSARDLEGYKSAHWHRLGYISLCDNERTSYQARELKSVPLDVTCDFLRLIVKGCHVNRCNASSQVGIVAINLLGRSGGFEDSLVKLPTNDMHENFNKDKKLVSSNVKTINHKLCQKLGRGVKIFGFSTKDYPKTVQCIQDIVSAKQLSVKIEDYDTAKSLKIAEDRLESLGKQLVKLEKGKQDAVEVEDYDEAKLFKSNILDLRKEVDELISGHEIASLIASVLPTPEWEGESDHVLTNGGGDPTELPFHDQIIPGKTNATAHVSPTNGIESPATISSPGDDDEDEVTAFGNASRNIKSHVDYESRVVSTNQTYSFNLDAGPSSDPLAQGGGISSSSPDGMLDLSDAKGFKTESGGGGHIQHKHDSSKGDVEAVNWPEGEHPLQGITNFLDLPIAEPLPATVEAGQAATLRPTLDPYVVQCLYSKVWQLREAAILKVEMILPELEGRLADHLSSLWQVVILGCNDRIAQVFTTTVKLLKSLLHAMDKKHGRSFKYFSHSFAEKILITLLTKMGDGQTRVRNESIKGIILLAHCKSIGGGHLVSTAALRPLPRKQVNAPKPIEARLKVLASLLEEFGVGESSGLSADGIVAFIKGCNAFSHSNSSVRDAARQLTVMVHAAAGPGSVEKYMKELRPKQREEYLEAFKEAAAGSSSALQPVPPTTSPPSSRKSRGRKQMPPPHRQPSPSPEKDLFPLITTSADNFGKEVESEDYDTLLGMGANKMCQFCGMFDASFTEEQLDLHYWQACPMLISCNECGQVIEICCMTEHMLEECTVSEQYVKCKKTGLAISKSKLDSWHNSRHCRRPLAGLGSLCPLCFTHLSSSDDEEIWRAHLIDGCPRNPRRE